MSHADSPGLDEILAYREIVSSDTPFAAFSDPVTQVSLSPRLEDLVAVNIVFTPDDTEDVAHAQMAIERPTAGREVIVPTFMAEYDRVVTPIQDEVAALSDAERAELNVDAAHAARQVLAEGRRSHDGEQWTVSSISPSDSSAYFTQSRGRKSKMVEVLGDIIKA